MTVKTFKDIKDILKEIPDEILDQLYFGLGEGQEEKIGIVSPEGKEEEGWPGIFDKINREYPQLNEIFKLLENINKFQEILNSQDEEKFESEIWEEGINSDTSFKLKDDLSDLVEQKLRKKYRKMKK